MENAGRRRGRHHRHARGPWLGGRPGRGPRRLRRWLPARRARLRPGLLRHLAPRGAVHGPAAAPAPGDRVGGLRTGRHRPRGRTRQPHRHVRRRHAPGLPGRPRRRRPGLPAHRQRHQHPLRAALLLLRCRRTGRDRRHRLLLLPGGPAPGRPVVARGGVLPGPGRRCHRHGQPHHLRRVRPPGRPRRRRALPVLRRRRQRHRLVRGRRRPRPGAALRGPPQRPPRPRGGPGVRRQPGRCLQRPDRPQRSLPAARHRVRPGQRPAHRRGRRRRRGARHRYGPR